MRAIQRDDRRRAEPDRQVVPHTKDVLRVDRRVVAGAAGGDDDVVDVAGPKRFGERPDDVRGSTQEAGGDLGLFEDLVAERHAWTGRRTGMLPRARASPASTSASASSDPGRIE